MHISLYIFFADDDIFRVIVDTHQYVLHRLAHTYKFMYKYMHSHHHRLYVPYAFGALYNHPLEGFLLDTCGAAIAFEATGMSPRLGMYFFVFSTLKTGKVYYSESLNVLIY
jgi:sphinganine C4-monooxygenase